MNKYFKRALLSFSSMVLVLSISACSEDKKETPPPAPTEKYQPESETVTKAFKTFNDFDFKNGDEQQLIADLKNTLNNPLNGETNPDIATSVALIELFELSSDPVIKKYFSI